MHPWNITKYPTLMKLTPGQIEAYKRKKREQEPVSAELGFTLAEAGKNGQKALVLAYAYCRGEYGVQKNEEQMEYWLHQAVQKGFPETASIAACCIGDLMYQRAERTADEGSREAYLRQSVRWYGKAAFGVEIPEPYVPADWMRYPVQENGWALYHLGYALMYGYGVQMDLECAKYMFAKSAQKGNGCAESMLEYIETSR